MPLEPGDVEPPFPREAAGVLEAFWELHAARGSNGYGPNPISYQELEAWSRLTGRVPSLWAIEQIRTLDRLYLSAYARMVAPDEN